MRLRKEEYAKRLDGFSTATLQLISLGLQMDEEIIMKMHDITTNSELNEEEVKSLLIQLLESV